MHNAREERTIVSERPAPGARDVAAPQRARRGGGGHGLHAAIVLALSAACAGTLAAQGADAPKPIADNSFLIEEAYNQDPGVVQHINSFSKTVGADAWAYTFTQEWPLFSQAHQISFTVPVQRQGGTGIGDVALNYRYQLVGPEGRVAAAPRFTLLAPTGNAARGLGAGAVGFQVALPVSVTLSPHFVTHANAGLTLTPSARDAIGNHATTTSVDLGASVVWLALSRFNVLVEAVWSDDQEVIGAGLTARERQLVVSPGIRWAYNFPGNVQVVPGIAYAIAAQPSSGDDALLLYLSIEHPFRKVRSEGRPESR